VCTPLVLRQRDGCGVVKDGLIELRHLTVAVSSVAICKWVGAIRLLVIQLDRSAEVRYSFSESFHRLETYCPREVHTRIYLLACGGVGDDIAQVL